MAEDASSTNEDQKNNSKTNFYPVKQTVFFTFAVNFQAYLKFPQDLVESGLYVHRILHIDSQCKAIHLAEVKALGTIDMDTLKMRLRDDTCALMSQRTGVPLERLFQRLQQAAPVISRVTQEE
ncbi:hypothetical protein STEG23_000002 [Scotinomys teguina]